MVKKYNTKSKKKVFVKRRAAPQKTKKKTMRTRKALPKWKKHNIPTAIVMKARTVNARIKQRGTSIRVSNREMVSAVIDNGFIDGAVGSFVNSSFMINPGMSGTFPWLSGIANNYETWKIHHVTFEYIPECATSTPGSIRMMIDPDSKDVAPQTVADMMANQIKSDLQPYMKSSVTITRKNVRFYDRPLLVTNTWPPPVSTTAAGFDQAEYLSGFFYLSTGGIGLTGTGVGRLFVTYDIELFNPCPRRPTGSPAVIASKTLTSGYTDVFAGASISTPTYVENAPNMLTFQEPGVYILSTTYFGSTSIYPATLAPSILGGPGTISVTTSGFTNAAPFFADSLAILTTTAGAATIIQWPQVAVTLANKFVITIVKTFNPLQLGLTKVTKLLNYVDGACRITDTFYKNAIKHNIAPMPQNLDDNYMFETDSSVDEEEEKIESVQSMK